MSWVGQNLLISLSFSFIIGALLVAILFWKQSSTTVWAWIDMLWIFLGGLSALTAILSSLYLTDINRVRREIDHSRSASQTLSFEIEIFLRSRCNARTIAEVFPNARSAYQTSCNGIALLAQSTQTDLAAFEVLEIGQPFSNPETIELDPDAFLSMSNSDLEFEAQLSEKLGSLAEVMDSLETQDWNDGVAEWQGLNSTDKFFNFSYSSAQIENLRSTGFYDEFAGEYLAIIHLAEGMNGELDRMKQTWDGTALDKFPLNSRNLALLLLAFVLPLRLGRSANDIRNNIRP